MRGMAVVGPLFPTDVHFFHKEASLCQLQSCFRRGLSIVSPAVGDDLLISRQNSCDPFQLVNRGAKCARDVSGGKGLFAACVKKDEVEFSVLDGMQDGRARFFSPKLMSEVLSVRANLIFSKSSHVYLQLVC